MLPSSNLASPASVLPAWSGSVAKAVAGTIGGCILLALSAQVRVALANTDVPMTLQPLAVALIGFTVSPAVALGATLAYLGCGWSGLPVLAAGSAGLAGPTGGYLVGFVVGAWVIALLRGPGRASYARLALAGTTGLAVVFLCGVSWCGFWLGGNWAAAVMTGLAPFVFKDILGVLLAASLVTAGRTLAEKQGR